MTERDEIYVQILHLGLLALRNAAQSGNASHCAIEAVHLQNLPSLIGETNEHRHAHYLNSERVVYLEHANRSVPEIGTVLSRYAGLWKALEDEELKNLFFDHLECQCPAARDFRQASLSCQRTPPRGHRLSGAQSIPLSRCNDPRSPRPLRRM